MLWFVWMMGFYVSFLYKVCKESGRDLACSVSTNKECLLHILVDLGLSVLETLFSATLTESDLIHCACFSLVCICVCLFFASQSSK